MSASRFLSDHDQKSRAGVRKPFGKGHGGVQREEGSGSGALHLLPCSRARDAGDVAVFDGLDVGREGLLAPWSCAFETFVPAAKFSRPTLPSPVPGDFAVRHVCLCHLGALARVQLWQMKVEDDDGGSRADEPRDKDEPKPDQGEEIKPSVEAMGMESSDDGHDSSDDKPSRTGQLVCPTASDKSCVYIQASIRVARLRHLDPKKKTTRPKRNAPSSPVSTTPPKTCIQTWKHQ
ncbi:hypothetical protein E5D57_012822 [Metarhizium anisopliae]|nr:hypothetical protein E5D57_012822 [Metarhizium anisopliae]